MRLGSVIGLVALGSVLPICIARAQAPVADSTAFRAGQWGAEFSIGSGEVNPAGAGVLRFTSARRALVLDLSGKVYRNSREVSVTETQSAVRVRVGTRWYRPVSRQVLQSLTLGVVASRERREAKGGIVGQSALPRTRSSFTGGGGFAELGGSWLVTPHLSLGAAWQGSVTYARGTQRTLSGGLLPPSSEERIKLWDASLGTLMLRVGVYF